jgi:thioester reductase-like protein
MRGGLPATIYRPAIVVGDSRTGVTQKYDGPYFVIRWLLRQPFVAVLPVVGNPSVTRVNLVPRDYVVDAISYLSGLDISAGKVYQLVDPAPLTVSELIKLVGHATRRIVVRIPLPIALAKFAIDRVPGVYRLMQIPSAAIDYFVHPTLYTYASTLADLEVSGVKVPPLPTYVDRLVDFVRRHPGIGSSPMA